MEYNAVKSIDIQDTLQSSLLAPCWRSEIKARKKPAWRSANVLMAILNEEPTCIFVPI
jgi:hypothetical protein